MADFRHFEELESWGPFNNFLFGPLEYSAIAIVTSLL
jgi:hypothetical protein